MLSHNDNALLIRLSPHSHFASDHDYPATADVRTDIFNALAAYVVYRPMCHR